MIAIKRLPLKQKSAMLNMSLDKMLYGGYHGLSKNARIN
jgi:hypothetical protein